MIVFKIVIYLKSLNIQQIHLPVSYYYYLPFFIVIILYLNTIGIKYYNSIILC